MVTTKKKSLESSGWGFWDWCKDTEIGAGRDVRSSSTEEKGNPLALIFNRRHISKSYNQTLFYLEKKTIEHLNSPFISKAVDIGKTETLPSLHPTHTVKLARLRNELSKTTWKSYYQNWMCINSAAVGLNKLLSFSAYPFLHLCNYKATYISILRWVLEKKKWI